MSTVSAPPPPAMPEAKAAPIRIDAPPFPPRSTRDAEAESGGEARIVIRGVTWGFYEHFVDGIPEGSHVRTAFDGNDLEIMSAGNIHEYFKKLIDRMVDVLCEALNVPTGSFGQATWKRPEVARGIEADECYYFDPEKLEMARIAVSNRSNDVADYPNPDLVIEIDISPSQVDRPGIYAALDVREVWRFNGTKLVMERLTEGKTYISVEQSIFLHIRPEEVVGWILDPKAWDRQDWRRRLHDWARVELVPRMARGPQEPEAGTQQGTESA